MKKILLLTVSGFLAFGAGAQKLQKNSNGDRFSTQKQPSVISGRADAVKVVPAQWGQFAKVTGVPFVTENFGTGTSSTLPTGWTAGTVAGNGTWKWTNTASGAQYSIGALNSTTAANGWMIYDSDSIGALTGATSLEGWLQSPDYNCTGHSTVQISFQEYFRRFNDSCHVQVSNNGGATWTDYHVFPNNSINSNDYVPSNPFTVMINVTGVAANQPAVRIRFRYKYSGPAGGGYNWLVDDLALSELDPVEVGLATSCILMSTGTGFTSFGSVPLHLADTIWPITFLQNNGSTAQPSVPVTATIYNGASQVYNQTVPYANLPVSAYDSLVDFTVNPGYLPAATGNHTTAFSISQAGDAVASNDIDTVRFSVTDTIYSANVGTVSGGYYYVHSPVSNGLATFFVGTIFEIPAGKSDTLSGASVAFSSNTTVGSKVRVQIYKFNSPSWGVKAGTIEKTLAASDISGTSNLVYSYFAGDISAGVGTLILDGGTYAAVVQGNGVANTATVGVLTSKAPARSDLAGFFGVVDTSMNDGAFDFASQGLPGGLTSVPIVRLHFGKMPTSIDDIAINVTGDAYPNPANSRVHIPFMLKNSGNVTVEVASITGQVVSTVNIGDVPAKEKREAVINTSGLAGGVYIYTLKANGEKVAGRFAVTHE